MWNDEGKRLGQHNPGKATKKEGQGYTVSIEHNQGIEVDAADYIMLSNIEHNAICIAAIYITDDHTSTAFFGDYAKQCGMTWHISNEEIGAERTKPRCFWLDGDNTNGHAQAMSFHIKDMVGNTHRQQQYKDAPDTMCKSTPRFSYWGNLLPDSRVPIFDPPLEYEDDPDNSGLGRDKDLARVLDLSKNFDKGVYMFRGKNSGLPTQEDYDWLYGYCEKTNGWEKGFCPQNPKEDNVKGKDKREVTMEAFSNPEKRSQKLNLVKRRPYRPGISDNLIITNKPGHSAVELCESETSYGPDTVSIVENTFCDMETKTLYPICDGSILKTCFDLRSKQLDYPNGHAGNLVRETPKDYIKVNVWG